MAITDSQKQALYEHIVGKLQANGQTLNISQYDKILSYYIDNQNNLDPVQIETNIINAKKAVLQKKIDDATAELDSLNH